MNAAAKPKGESAVVGAYNNSGHTTHPVAVARRCSTTACHEEYTPTPVGRSRGRSPQASTRWLAMPIATILTSTMLVHSGCMSPSASDIQPGPPRRAYVRLMPLSPRRRCQRRLRQAAAAPPIDRKVGRFLSGRKGTGRTGRRRAAHNTPIQRP